MKEIWKFKVENVIEMPKGAEILTIKLKTENWDSVNDCIWAKVDPEMEKERRRFVIIGTGESFDDTNTHYIGTYQNGPFAWHLFEIKQ
jgi:hypothetical protein